MSAASDTLKQSLMTALFSNLVIDNMNEFSYPAALAGLYYSVGKGERGIGFSVGGYDDKQQVLMTRIIDTLVSFRIDPERFAVIKQQMKQNWDNTHLDRPYQQLNRALNTLLQPRSWTPDAYLTVIDDITVADLEQHIDKLWQRAYIKMLIHGNIDRNKASRLATDIIARLRKQVKPAPSLKRDAVELSAESGPHRFSLDIDHNDSAIVSYYQAPDDQTLTQARNLLLLQILEAPFFNQLRTAEQLGYVVYAGQANSLRIPAIKFVIQSPVKGPQALLKHIDDFLQQEYTAVNNMDASEFNNNKQAILTQLLEKDKRLNERTQRYRYSLALKYLNFNHREELADAIRKLTLQEISDYYKTLLLSDQQRHVIIESTGVKHRDANKISNGKMTDKLAGPAQPLTMDAIEAFRASQGDYSL